MKFYYHKPVFMGILIAAMQVLGMGKTYYVSPSGVDNGAGTIDHPWKHIAFATCGGSYACSCAKKNSYLLNAGDTLFVRGGTYFEHDIRMKNTGKSNAWIVIKAFQNEKDTIDCQHIASGFNMGTSQTNNYIVLDGLFLKNPWQAGIRIGENFKGDHWIIKNCRFEGLKQADNSACVFLSTSCNTRIDNCVMIGNNTTNFNYCGIQIFRGDGSDTIINCDISHFAEGIFYKHGSLGDKQTLIKNNFIRDNSQHGLWISSDHVTIQNNLVIHNGAGVVFWEDAGGTGGGYSSVLHNTFYNNDYTVEICSRGELNARTGDHGAKHDTIKNNILFGTNSEMGSLAMWPDPDPHYDSIHATISNHNCYYNTGENQVEVIREFGETYTLPQWKARCPKRDSGSINEKPVFAKKSGVLCAIEDFEITGGRAKNGASDGADMGADVSLIKNTGNGK